MSRIVSTEYRDQTRTPVTDRVLDSTGGILSLRARQHAERIEQAQRHDEEWAHMALHLGKLAEQQIRPLEQKKSGETLQPSHR